MRVLLFWNKSLAVITLWKDDEKDDSTDILKNIEDVLKIDGHHPQSEELELKLLLKVTPILSWFLRMKIDR